LRKAARAALGLFDAAEMFVGLAYFL